jgi:hypothetical protein
MGWGEAAETAGGMVRGNGDNPTAPPPPKRPATKDEGEPSQTVYLREDGLLWLINRTTFHPRGYALGYDEDTGKFELYGDGSEPWKFGLGDDLEQVLFDAVARVMPCRPLSS